jgi:hypothetical protein
MTDAVHFPQIRRSEMRKTLKILLVALLPFCVEAVGWREGCSWNEACDADDFCAIKHDNSDMITFRGGWNTYSRGVCGDLDGEYFEKPSKWINTYGLDECYICSERRKGRKLLGGPIPPNTDPLNNFGNICCAMKLEECCMPNPYAWSGLPYAAAHGLIITFNVMFWIYVVIIGVYLLSPLFGAYPEGKPGCCCGVQPGDEHKQWWIIMFRELSLITIFFWTFPLWFPLYIVPSFGYMIYKRDSWDWEFLCEAFCMLFADVVRGRPLND